METAATQAATQAIAALAHPLPLSLGDASQQLPAMLSLGAGVTVPGGEISLLVTDAYAEQVTGGELATLPAALQPALDAAASALNHNASAARALGAPPVGVVVPILAAGAVVAALVVPRTVTANAPAGNTPGRGLEILHGVDMDVTVELGRTRLTVRELLALAPGTVLELDRAAGSPADLLVNGKLIARGEVVVVDEDFGLRITELATEQTGG